MPNSSILKLLVLFLLVTASAHISFGQENGGKLSIEPYVFESAKKDKVQAELGHFTVPENRSKPNSRKLKLSFVRFKSTSKNPGAPIVYLAGGPGGSGILSAKYNRFPLFMAMREIGDVIAFDQRGTGISEPNLNYTETLSYPISKAPSPEEFNKIYVKESRKCAERFKKQGVDLSAYNTKENADDIEDLRKALGAEKISLWGISYGTHLTLATLKRHEKSIDRVIMAGVEALDHTLKLPGNVQKHIENLDRLAKTDAALSKEIPSLKQLMADVLLKLEREPAIVEVTNPKTKKKVKVTVNKFVIQMLTVFAFGSGDDSLPLAYYGMSKGDFSFAANRWLGLITAERRIGSAMTFMMDCHSGASQERLKQIDQESRHTLLGDVMNFPFPGVCEGWGNPDAGDKFREPVGTNVPTLFISGTLDVRTPPSNAEEARKGFPKSSHLIIDGAVHSDPLFLSSPKIQETMLRFMKGEELPSEIRIGMQKPFSFNPLPG